MERHHPSRPQPKHDQVDPLLLPYLLASDESESRRLAEQLILARAGPIINGIVAYKLTVSPDRSWNSDKQDAEDVSSEVILELVAWLRKFKAEPENNPIRNFRGFVAALAYRACSTYLRKKHPRRVSLKNKIHHTLTHHTGFALWKDGEDQWLCGLSAWSGHNSLQSSARLQLLRDDPRAFEQSALPSCDIRQMSAADLLAAIFSWLEAPIKLDDLISAVAELWGIHEVTAETHSGTEAGDKRHRAPNNQISFVSEMEQRGYLQQVWVEIGRLPLRQRCALLLNLTDSPGHGVIALLPALGIASVRQIAATLGMSDEQLAELWNSLPLDDVRIAAHLGVTRQQVINLRKSARERLVRRMKSAEGNRELVFSTARS